MGAIVQSSAMRARGGRNLGIGFPQIPTIIVHWDGVANRKQNTNLSNGVIWVNTAQLLRTGQIQVGMQFQSMGAGAGNIAIAGCMAPGRFADILAPGAEGDALVTKVNPMFVDIDATVANTDVVTTSTCYTLLRITFAVNTPATLNITAV